MNTITEWFSDPGLAAFAHWSVAALALIISAIALWASWRTQRRHGVLQGQLLEIEQARVQGRQLEARKARLRADITSEFRGKTKQYRLQIRNEGEGAARDIVASLEDIPIIDHPAIPTRQKDISEIGPFSEARYLLAINYDRAPPWKFRVTWRDDSRTPGEYQTTLTI